MTRDPDPATTPQILEAALNACKALEDLDRWIGVATPYGVFCPLCGADDEGLKPTPHRDLCPIPLARAALVLADEVHS